MANILNKFLTVAFDLMLRPFGSLHPLWALAAVSFATGILMLWIFGKVSDQDSIRLVRDNIRGNLIAIRLFGDDLGTLARLQGRILRQTATYLRYAFVPFLILLIPVVLILLQLELRFALKPLEVGDRAVVKVTLRDASPLGEPVRLELPEGLTLETSGVRIESLREVAWRIRADQPGDYELLVRAGDETERKKLVVGSGWAAVSPVRTGRSVLEMLRYPGEAPIAPSRKCEAIEVKYAELPLRLFGWNLHWLLVFFVLSIAFGFAFRRPFGVEI